MNETVLLLISLAIIVPIAVLIARRILPRIPARNDSQAPSWFANLLVTEIQMHDPKAVERAWQQAGLYQELKGEIDRAREMFITRFPSEEPEFYGALVNHLAKGDESRLGPGYPYLKVGLSDTLRRGV